MRYNVSRSEGFSEKLGFRYCFHLLYSSEREGVAFGEKENTAKAFI
jgi:hypothetical protein